MVFKKIFIHICEINIFKQIPLYLRFFTTNKTNCLFNHKYENIETKHDSIGQKNLESINNSTFKSSVRNVLIENKASFANLFRFSSLIHMGDIKEKIVVGKIIEVVNNDLYIDFGWKFHCVCPKPVKNNSDYVRGAKVRLAIKDLELSTRFLRATKDVTLLEADCILLSLINSPNKICKNNN